MVAWGNSSKSCLMSQVTAQDYTSRPAGLTWHERNELTNFGCIRGLSVMFIDNIAYVGLNYTIASWTIERTSGKLWVARFADGVGCPCEGWRVAVNSVEDAMARVHTDSETEGWNR